MKRVMHLFPHQSDRDPWRNTQNYTKDKKMVRGERCNGVVFVPNHRGERLEKLLRSDLGIRIVELVRVVVKRDEHSLRVHVASPTVMAIAPRKTDAPNSAW